MATNDSQRMLLDRLSADLSKYQPPAPAPVQSEPGRQYDAGADASNQPRQHEQLHDVDERLYASHRAQFRRDAEAAPGAVLLELPGPKPLETPPNASDIVTEESGVEL